MKHISIKPAWTIQEADGLPLSTRLIELLVQVHAEGSLQKAASKLQVSYRHAWDLVRQGESHFNAPLLRMERGKGSSLTELGEKIVWADHRIMARLQPALDSLASELAAELHRTLSESAPILRVHASHGFAVERLLRHLGDQGLQLEITYGSSSSAASALHDGDCDVAGFHIPLGDMQAMALEHYRAWLCDEELTIIDIAHRRQGLMVRSGNPKEIYSLSDLTRDDVRFINRQTGSGSRLLLEGMLQAQGLSSADIAGFEHGEYTHAAVAAYVASGMADVGFGLEPPARQFKLDFVPVASEQYFLLCRNGVMNSPAVQAILEALQDNAFRERLAELPGYDPAASGNVVQLYERYPTLAQRTKR
ncbi:substrate-binding domain-containing protein [Hydrogenophaga sp. 5NK40-0174]|uniref:substrate-binding domain-containing protein n=1 Tax=Hydrogenophaga sp. 5NK40-0174 TaxID=3127649 RepID=UPI003107C209